MISRKIKRMINGALMDEHGARLYYTKLMDSTHDRKVKIAIREIRNDEIDHFKKLALLEGQKPKRRK